MAGRLPVSVNGPWRRCRLAPPALCDAALVDVDRRAEDPAGPADEPLVAHEVGEDAAELVDLGDRADLAGVRFDDGALVLAQHGIVDYPVHLGTEGLHLGGGDQVLDAEEAVAFVGGQFRAAEGAGRGLVGGGRPDDGVAAFGERLGAAAAGVRGR